MTDLISRADAIDAVAEEWLSEASAESPYVNDYDIDKYRELAEELFADIPSADAVQGEWIRITKEYNDCDGHRFVYWYECDQCGARPPKDQWKNEWHSNYCPSCGARMKGGDSE